MQNAPRNNETTIGRIGQPDPPDLRPAFLECMDAVYRYIFVRVAGDPAAAEEILQQTACAVLHQPNAPQAAAEHEWWIRGIARNLVRRYWRVRKRDARRSVGEGGLRYLVEAPTPDGAMADVVDDEEQRARLLQAIAALPAADQWLLYEFYKHGRTRGEIAAATGTTIKGVEAKLYRMRGRLRTALTETGEEPRGDQS
ncbi:MAG: RNA polymerase sigma factor [Planctomycetota bacterium]